MLKKIILIITFLITTSCGYEAMYSLKNSIKYNFSITDISFEGDRDVNQVIKRKLNNYIINKKDKEFRLNIKSVTERLILAKDTAGEATTFKNNTTTTTEVFDETNLLTIISIEKSFKYDNMSNKFDLQQYEKELKRNLAETIIDELTFKLSNIQ